MRTQIIFALLAVMIISSQAFLISPSRKRYQKFIQPHQKASHFEKAKPLVDIAEFTKGVLNSFNIRSNSDSTACHTSQSALSMLVYYQMIAAKANVAASTKLHTELYHFFDTTGKKILSKVDSSINKCVENSKDFNKIEKRLGVNPHSQAFNDAFIGLVRDAPDQFSRVWGDISDDLFSRKFTDAGNHFGEFIQLVAKRAALTNTGKDGDL